MKNLILLLTLFCSVTHLTAQATESGVGNGSQLIALEGFENYLSQSKAMKDAITDALELVRNLALNTKKDFPQLAYLSEEIEYSRYILVPQNVEVRPNRAPGDYPIGGYLVASTETRRGAPTKIYPRLITSLSSTQLVQMVIHEALHRALPQPMSSYESAVEKITSILTQYSQNSVVANLTEYFAFVNGKKLPWLVKIKRNCPQWSCESDDDDQEEKAHIQKILNPLLDDSTLSETLMDETRIQIIFHIHATKGFWGAQILKTSSIDIKDTYRQTFYTFAPSSEELSNADEVTEKATQFIRDTINKIQQDLQW